MEIIEDYHKDFSDRYYQAQAINKANKSRATNKVKNKFFFVSLKKYK